MIWWAGVILLLLVAVVFDLGLLAYAMYVLLAVMLVSRFLTRRWTESLAAMRECNRTEAEIGQTVAVNVTLQNKGNLPIPWVLVEDLLPREALIYDPPRLKVTGRRVQSVAPAQPEPQEHQLPAHADPPRLLSDWAAGAGDGRPVWPAPAVSRGHRAALFAGAAQGHSAGRL